MQDTWFPNRYRGAISFLGREYLRLAEECDISYWLKIAEGFCPYMRPSSREQVLFLSRCRVNGRNVDEVSAQVFWLATLATEWLRNYRMQVGRTPKAALACENVIIEVDESLDGIGKQFLSWPHWLLKVIYSRVGLMFGKFWKGEEGVSVRGFPIPPPPVHFLSIRSAIKARDPVLLGEKTPRIVADLLEANDTGEDVLHVVTSVPRAAVGSMDDEEIVQFYGVVKQYIEKST